MTAMGIGLGIINWGFWFHHVRKLMNKLLGNEGIKFEEENVDSAKKGKNDRDQDRREGTSEKRAREVKEAQNRVQETHGEDEGNKRNRSAKKSRRGRKKTHSWRGEAEGENGRGVEGQAYARQSPRRRRRIAVN